MSSGVITETGKLEAGGGGPNGFPDNQIYVPIALDTGISGVLNRCLAHRNGWIIRNDAASRRRRCDAAMDDGLT